MADTLLARIPVRLHGHLAMLCFSALVAGSFSLGSLIANDIAPAALTAMRFLLAASIMGALALANGGVPRAALRAPWRYFILGALFGAYFVLMFEALKTAAPVSTAAVFTLTPVMSAGFGWLLMRQVTTARMGLALGIGALGALWVIFRADLAAALAFEVGQGEMLFFVACIFHAIFAPMLRFLHRGEGSFAYSFLLMTAGFLVLTAWGLGDLKSTDWATLPALVWITLIYLAVFASAGSAFMLQFAARQLPSAKVMAYTYLTPSWVILWEIALGHGVPPLLVMGGIALTIVALAMLLKDESSAVR